MRSIDKDFQAAVAMGTLTPETVEQLEHSARALSSMLRWMATSITATRSVEPGERLSFRTAASYFARQYGLYVTVEEGALCSACFFRRDD